MSNIRDPYNNVRRVSNRNNKIDTHEILKREIYKQTDDNNYQFTLSSTPISPVAAAEPVSISSAPSSVGIADTYLYFESHSMDTSSDLINGEIKFSIINLNNSNSIDACIEIRLGDIYFPLIKNATTAPDYYFFRRIYALITSISSTQSFLANNLSQFHFEFDVENLNSVAVRIYPTNPSFYFKQPVNSMSEFSLRFFAPDGNGGFKKIPLAKTMITVQAVVGSNPGQFTIVAGDDITNLVDAAIIPSTYPGVAYAPSPTVAVYITGFVSGTPTIDAAVNSLQGLFVTNFLTNMFTFQIATLDFTTLPAGTFTATLSIAKNRIAIPVRFTSVTTNNKYITAFHD